MRFVGFAAVVVLTSGHLAPAQNPPKSSDDLEKVLAKWEKAMSGLSKFQVKQATRTHKDVIFGDTTTYQGDLKFLAPRRYLWDLKRVDEGKVKSDDFLRFVSTGTMTYLYAPRDKLIYAFPFPGKTDPPKGDHWLARALNGLRYLAQKMTPGADEGSIFNVPFPLLKISELKKQYTLTLTTTPAGNTRNYFIEFVPREFEQRQIIVKAQLILSRVTHLPRQFSYEEPNGNLVIWEYPTFLTATADVRPEEFAAPKPLSGWTLRQHELRDEQ
jgi:hypothetical protein